MPLFFSAGFGLAFSFPRSAVQERQGCAAGDHAELQQQERHLECGYGGVPASYRPLPLLRKHSHLHPSSTLPLPFRPRTLVEFIRMCLCLFSFSGTSALLLAFRSSKKKQVRLPLARAQFSFLTHPYTTLIISPPFPLWQVIKGCFPPCISVSQLQKILFVGCKRYQN